MFSSVMSHESKSNFNQQVVQWLPEDRPSQCQAVCVAGLVGGRRRTTQPERVEDVQRQVVGAALCFSNEDDEVQCSRAHLANDRTIAAATVLGHMRGSSGLEP